MSEIIKQVASTSLLQLKAFLLSIEESHYVDCSDLLLGASIGQHVRHVLEFYVCFKEGFSTGVVNYDLRKRDLRVEQNKLVAIELIDSISEWVLNAKPRGLLLEGAYGTDHVHVFSIDSHFDRELVYNIEHAVHHMAIIKIAGISLYQYPFPANFGLADSTLTYQATHVHR
jgi:hypothetical protein